MLSRLDFFWWGRFWRGWLQWGPINMCADKDWNVTGKGWLIGPVQVTWWDRSNWRDYRYTKEEADEIDRQENEDMRRWRTERSAVTQKGDSDA